MRAMDLLRAVQEIEEGHCEEVAHRPDGPSKGGRRACVLRDRGGRRSVGVGHPFG
jgi:hypothetical protein